MVKVDYNSDIYKHIVVNSDGKIIGWVTDEGNPKAYDFDGKKIGQAITDGYAKKYYNRMVYTKIKENIDGFYEPAKDSKEVGKVIGNITRVMFKKVNDNFKVHLALIAEMMKYDAYDDYHDADDEKNSSVYQYKKGMNEFFDDHIDNSKLGLDSGSIKAAKGQFFGSIDNCGDSESVTELLKDAIKQNNMFTGETVELDKDGNIEVHKLNTLILNYNVLIVNMAILLAITVVAVVANKKKKGNDPTSIGPTAVTASGDPAGGSDPSWLTAGTTGPTAVTASGDPAGGYPSDPATDSGGYTAVTASGDPAGGSDPSWLTAGTTGPTAVPGPSLADQFIFNSAFSDLINSLY